MKYWAIITGAGTGIGSALAKELASSDYHILAIGRRSAPLELTKNEAKKPNNIIPLVMDIAENNSHEKIIGAIPQCDEIKFLIQNAAVGVPSKLLDINQGDFEYAMRVNVTAPLMLTKYLFPRLKRCLGRIVHLGTGVAFKAQLGTTTYGVTKMAFHRLYEQLRVELDGSGVQIANILPGVVDTEGLWEHIRLARGQQLPHVGYFDQVEKEGKILSAEMSAKFIRFVLLETSKEEFSREWNIHDESHHSRWRKVTNNEKEMKSTGILNE